MAQNGDDAAELSRLRAENKKLKRELSNLRQQSASSQTRDDQPSQGPIWRKIAVVVSVICATSLLVAGNLLFWAGNTIVDPQKFSDLTGELIKEPEVQQAISEFTATKVFERVDVEQLLSENLPPRIEFAAPALATQIQSATQNAFLRVTQNSNFQETWNSSVSVIHERFINFVRNYQGDGTLQLADVYNKVIARTEGTKLEFLSNVSLPSHIGSITIKEAPWLPAAHNVVNNIGLYQILTTLFFVIFVGLAIWLSVRRRRTAIIIGILIAVFMILTLISIRLAQQSLTGGAPADYQGAAQVVSEQLVRSLIFQTRALFLIGVLIAVVAWISGPYKSATLIRGRIEALFGGNIHQALIGEHDNGFTRWLGEKKQFIRWSFVAIAALIIILSPASVQTILWVIVILVVALLVLEIVAAPPTNTVRRRN